MALLLMTYNLFEADEDRYEQIGDAIQELGETWHDWEAFDSVWWLSADLTPDEGSEVLMEVITDGDHLYVVDITGQEAQGYAPEVLWPWLESQGGA